MPRQTCQLPHDGTNLPCQSSIGRNISFFRFPCGVSASLSTFDLPFISLGIVSKSKCSRATSVGQHDQLGVARCPEVRQGGRVAGAARVCTNGVRGLVFPAVVSARLASVGWRGVHAAKPRIQLPLLQSRSTPDARGRPCQGSAPHPGQ